MARNKLTKKRRVLGFIATVIFPASVILSPANAIQGGSDGQNPPNVVFIIGEGSSCSGALLSPVVVATAAHCLVNSSTGLLKKDIYVAPPGVNIEKNSQGEIIVGSNWAKVTSTQITSTYSDDGSKVADNDVSFIVLNKPFELKVETVIPSEEESEKFISDKASVRIYGYGNVNFATSADKAMMSIMKIETKSPSLKNTIWLTSGNSTACPGDSGGPVIYSTPTKVVVLGIISGGLLSETGPNCARKNNDGQYWSSVTLLSRYANLAFGAAASALAEAEKRMADQKKLADDYYQAALKAKEVAETNFQIGTSYQTRYEDLKSEFDGIYEQNLRLEQELSLANDKLSQLQTITCVKGKKRVAVEGIKPFCPAGYKKR